MEGEPVGEENLQEEALRALRLAQLAKKGVWEMRSRQDQPAVRQPLTTGDMHADQFGLPRPSDALAKENDSPVR